MDTNTRWQAMAGLALLTALGGRISEAAMAYEYSAGDKRLVQMDNILSNSGSSAVSVACPYPLAAQTRLSFAVRFPERSVLTLRTGRGREALTIRLQEGQFRWTHTSPDGAAHNRRPYPGGTSHTPLLYWWERDAYTPRGRLQPSFSLPPQVRDWSAYYQSLQNRALDKEWWTVAVELADGRLRWYFDDILLQDQAASAEVAGRKLNISLSPGLALQPVRQIALGEPQAGFVTVNLANRCNTKGRPVGLPEGRFIRDGIPFETAARPGGENGVDLGVSWFREGNLDSGDAPNNGTFGGRWAGALSANPTRVQFRVPNGRYEALVLLATAEARPDRINRVTAQFYRPGSGFPVNFTTEAPIPTDGRLHLVRIPIRPDALLAFADREVIELELTGDVHVYRASPDPLHYSMHGGGLPPGVTVYAMTLALAPVEVDFQPEAFGNVWVNNRNPAYRVALRNTSREDRTLALTLRTTSYDGDETTVQTQQVAVAAGGEAVTRFDLALVKYGWHGVVLDVDGEPYERSLVILQRREYTRRPFDAPGYMFGVWAPGRTHYTPSVVDNLRLAGPLGIESISHNAWMLDDPEVTALGFGLKNFMAVRHGVRPRDVDVPDLATRLQDARIAPSDVNEPVFQYLFAEPGGIGSIGSLPEFYGEPPLTRTPEEEARFAYYKGIVTNYARVFRQVLPGKKILMPWGNPLFAIPFLQDPDSREAFDGIGFDTAFFDRLPEMQVHQCSLHGLMMPFNHYWRQYRQDPPLLVTVEGPCLGGVKPGALTADQHAAHLPRAILTLAGHGITRFFASVSGTAEYASYWGEQHYGGGAFSRITLNPYPAYATQGTLIRHLRHMVFTGAEPTGSLSTYCYGFKDARNGKRLHILWTIRGTRPVKMRAGAIFDSMDNPVTGPLVIGQLPVYVYDSDGRVELGEPDHRDVQLATHHQLLGNVADLFPTQTQEADEEYLASFPRDIRRFPAAMELTRTADGLAIKLPPQPVDRGVMPFYTTLQPEKPIVIPGQARYITMEVTAASDWGRVVYVLRDAKGERWISVGTRDTYSNDDTPNASFFNFDGRRLVRFELPSNLPWDHYREMGSTWWGATGGDQVVDLPLAIERLHIERRPQAVYVDRLVPTVPAPVVLGALHAEYASADSMRVPPAIAMPAAPVSDNPVNPIVELSASATLPATRIEKVTEPEHYYDGTRGHFHFKEVEQAKTYDIYLSLDPTGANAIKLGSGLKESGALVSGFLANTDFYAFVVYTDAEGRHSHPSPPFKLKLMDTFANK